VASSVRLWGLRLQEPASKDLRHRTLDVTYSVPRRERFWALAQRMHSAYRGSGMTAIEIEAALEREGERTVEAMVARAERR